MEKNQRHGTSSMFFLVSTQKTWLSTKQNGWLGGGLHDIFVEGFCQMLWPGNLFVFSPGGVTHIKKQKKLARVGSWFDVFYHLRKFESNKPKRTTSVGMRLEGRLIGWSGWLLETWVCNLVSPQIDRRAPPTWKICFSNYELFQETTTYSSKQSCFGIIDIPNDTPQVHLVKIWYVLLFQGTFASFFSGDDSKSLH